jgi:hypothetical protein
MEVKFYRGVRYNVSDVVKEATASEVGIYRGIRHNALPRESAGTVSGLIYRGTKH